MSLSSSRTPYASISKKTAGDGPLRSGWQMKVSISPSLVVMSWVFSIKRCLLVRRSQGVAKFTCAALFWTATWWEEHIWQVEHADAFRGTGFVGQGRINPLRCE